MTPCRLLGYCVVTGGSFIWVLASTAHGQQKQLPPEQVEYFEKSVRPILANHCLECHGPEKHKASLRLDSRATMMSGGVSGPAIVPGSPKDSLLINAIHYVDNPKMPPTGKLGDTEIAVLTEWIKQGAPW